MNQTDSVTTIEQLKEKTIELISARNWEQFHTPKNLSAKIVVEAGELLEKFVWLTAEQSLQEVEKNRLEIEHEVADIFICLLAFCNIANIDLTQAMLTKLEEVKKKYPVDKCKGIATKYNKL